MSATEDDLQTAFEYIDKQQASLLTLELTKHQSDRSLSLLFARALQCDQLDCARAIIVLKGVQAFANSTLEEKLNQTFIDAALKGSVSFCQSLKGLLEHHRLISQSVMNSALQKASQRGELESVKFLLSEGARVNQTDVNGNTALHLAVLALIEKLNNGESAQFNQAEKDYFFSRVEQLKKVIDYLLEKKANPSLQNLEKISPIELAAEKAPFDVFSMLNTDERSETTLLWACQKGYLSLANTIIEQLINNEQAFDVGIAEEKSEHSQTLSSILASGLFVAIEHHHEKLVTLLLEFGADFNLPQGKERLSAIRLAFNNAHTSCAKELYRHIQTEGLEFPSMELNRDGLSLYQTFEEEAKDHHPLILAARNDQIEEVESALEKALDINSRDSSGKSALFYASIHGNIPLMQLLINRGAKQTLADQKNRTPIIYAIKKKQYNALKLLIESGANLEQEVEPGKSLYEYALEMGDHPISELLFHEMTLRGIRVLKERVCLSERESLMHQSIRANNQMDPAIHQVIERDDLSSSQKIGEIKDLVDTKNARINAKNKDGHSPISLAVHKLDLVLIQFILTLLKPKEFINDCFILHFAAENGFNQLIERLMEENTESNMAEAHFLNDHEPHVQTSTGIIYAHPIQDDSSSKTNYREEEQANALLDKDCEYEPFSEVMSASAPPMPPSLLLNQLDENGVSALEKAAQKKQLSTISLLLRFGAMLPFENGKIKDSLFMNDESAYELYKHFRSQGKRISQNILAEKGQAFIKKINQKGGELSIIENPLFKAIKEKNSTDIHQLVINGADLDELDIQGFNTLHWAVTQGDFPLIQFLHQHGADINLMTHTDGLTPFHRAALVADLSENKDKKELFTEILNYLYLKMRKPFSSPSDAANLEAKKTQMGFAEQLIEAASENQSHQIQALNEMGVYIDEQDNKGQSALSKASMLDEEGSHLATIAFLLQLGASPSLADNKGWSPFLHALSLSKLKLASLMLPKILPENLEQKDSLGRTPLMNMVLSKNLEAVSFLLEHGASLSAIDNEGKTVLMHAASTNNQAIITAVLDRGKAINDFSEGEANDPLRLNEKDKDGYSILHLAALSNNLALMNQLLMLFNININLITKHHQTALHLAAENGYLNLVRLMIKHGANVHSTDLNFKTPAELATEQNHSSIIEYFAFLSIYQTEPYRFFRNQSSFRVFNERKKTVSLFRDVCLNAYLNGWDDFSSLPAHSLSLNDDNAFLIFNQVKENLDSAQSESSPHYHKLQALTNNSQLNAHSLLRQLQQIELDIEKSRILEKSVRKHQRTAGRLEARSDSLSNSSGLGSPAAFFQTDRPAESSVDSERKADFRKDLIAACSLDLNILENRRLWQNQTSSHTYTDPRTKLTVKVAQTVKEVLITLDRYQNKFSYDEMILQLQRVARESNERRSRSRDERVVNLINKILNPEEFVAVKARTNTY